MATEPLGGTVVLPDVGMRPEAAPGRRLPFVPLTIISVFVLLGLLGPYLGLPDPYEQSLRSRFRPPSR